MAIYIKYTELVQFFQFVGLLNRLDAFTVFKYIQLFDKAIGKYYIQADWLHCSLLFLQIKVLRSNSCNFFKDLTQVASPLS